MDPITAFIQLAVQLGPAIGIVGILGIIAAAYLYRENNRLRAERNLAVEKAEEAAKLALEKKDEYIKEQTAQILTFGTRSTDALLKVAYAVEKNTKSNDKLSEAVYTILKANKPRKNNQF